MSTSRDNEPEQPNGWPLFIGLLYVIATIVGYHYQTIRSWFRKYLIHKPTYFPKRIAWLFQDRPLWAWVPLLGSVFIIMARGGIPPMDDLVRHIGAYRHHFDYHDYYLYSQDLYSVRMDPWIGFEWIVGHLHQFIWNSLEKIMPTWSDLNKNIWALGITLHSVVMIAFALFGMIFMPIFRHAFRHHPMRHTMVGFALIALLIMEQFWRLQLGRPEIFMMLAMFSVWRLPPRIWVTLMMLLQPLYWLSWMYCPGVLLISQWTKKQKIIAICLILSVYSIFWQWYCGLNAIVHFSSLTLHALETRTLLPVRENLSPLRYLFRLSGLSIVTWMLLIHIIYRWGDGPLHKSERLSILIVMLIYTLTDQIRYFYYCGPCLVYLWAWQSHDDFNHQHHYQKTVLHPYLPLLLMVTAGISSIILPSYGGFKSQLIYFKTLPSQAKILTFFDQSTFELPTLYPTVRVAPSMELGFSDRTLQNFYIQYHTLKRHTPIDCKYFRQTFGSFTYIVDRLDYNLIVHAPSSCMKLKEQYGDWLLWYIKP